MTKPEKFRKRPVVIEAMQLLDDINNHRAICAWVEAGGGTAIMPMLDPCLYIDTLEGRMRADLGDWIICGVAGEFYPCKDSIFAATYEPEEPTA